MRIGEVAQIVGISARSIRHYHRMGIMAEPERTTGGYRDYDVADLARIARIAFLSSSGVPLREVGALLEAETTTSTDPATDLAVIRDGIDRQIEQLARQRERLDVISQRASDGLPPGLLPEPVARALDICRRDVAGNPDLTSLLDRERDMLDLVALAGAFPEPLASSYTAIGSDPDRRRAYLDLLAGFHAIEGRRPADVESEIAALVDALLADADLRRLVTGSPSDANAGADAGAITASQEPNGPTLDQLLPDPAQREVLRRTLTALGVLA